MCPYPDYIIWNFGYDLYKDPPRCARVVFKDITGAFFFTYVTFWKCWIFMLQIKVNEVIKSGLG